MKALKNIFVCTAITAAMCSTGYAANLVQNSSFDQKLSHATPNSNGEVNTAGSWIFFTNNGGSANFSLDNGKLTASSTNLSAPPYGVQLIQAPINLEAGGKYTLTFDASAAGASELTVKVGSDASRQYYGYFVKSLKVNGDKQYQFKFDMMAESDPKARLEFWFAKAEKPITIDNVSLEKTGEITIQNRLGVVKFDPNKTYTTLAPNENFITDKMVADLNKLTRGKRFGRDITLEEDSNYVFDLKTNAKSTSKLEVGLIDDQGKLVTKQIITVKKGQQDNSIKLKFSHTTTDVGELFVKRLSGSGKLNVEKASFTKFIGKLIWDDEFDNDGSVDASKWSHDVGGNGWGNGEAQLYTPIRKNAYVADGKLHIKTIRERKGGNKYTSARLTTKNKGDFLYGRIEVNAKLPGGRGVWPAIWMLSTDNAYGIWPNSGEIDIMEYVGYEPNKVHATIHTKKYSWLTSNQKTSEIEVSPKAVQDGFHTYALEWTPKLLKVYKDNELYYTYANEGTGSKAWPFNKKFHLILNTAVGGSWGGVKGIDNSIFPQQFVFDYVRVYDLGYEQ